MRKRIALFFLLLIFLAGCLISLFPVINELLYREKMKTTVSEFQSNTEHQPPVIILPSGDARLKDQAFKDEFDHLINTLRGLEAPDASRPQHKAILSDGATLTSYCYQHPDSKRPGFYGRELTLRADTQKHAYILRLNPKKGDYNLYCYCYRKDWFDRHLNNAEKGIRFIDPNYKELFRIEDGDIIRYFTNSGEPRHLICRYIDDYHFEATSDRGKSLYHICEFAELYQNHGCHGIIPLRKSLPESCFSTLGATGQPIKNQRRSHAAER